jgi:hypothetical protein
MAIRSLVGAAILMVALPAGVVIAQKGHDQEQRTITLVGCVMRESQYRDMYGPGLSGPRGAGIGGRNDYMLVDAHEVGTAGTNPGITPATTGASCPPAPGTFPTAYEMTGSREGELAPFLGRRVEVTGIEKEAHVRPVGTSGQAIDRPTGGFDPLGHELHLFEVEVQSAREPAAYAEAPAPAPAPVAEAAPAPVEQPAAPAPAPPVAAAAPPPAPEPEPAPAPEQQAAAPAPEAPAAPVEEGRIAQQLPRSASPLPLTGLIGFLSLAAGAGIRMLRRRG